MEDGGSLGGIMCDEITGGGVEVVGSMNYSSDISMTFFA